MLNCLHLLFHFQPGYLVASLGHFKNYRFVIFLSDVRKLVEDFEVDLFLVRLDR
jgi:hypothetical protein